MPGKAYTMREMKQIVEYLTEHNAYGEIRGRKMWVDFASSKSIDRSWQSLKETFMKRILPDIHNPYYKLTVTQIASFRQGVDVTSKNKLEIHTISDSSSNAEININKEQPSTSKNHEQNSTGESIKCSKIEDFTRASTDTLVLETYDQNAEDIKNDQVSPNKTNYDVAMKSLRDCIIYTEPLTPMLQEVLHDFDTDDDDDEPKLQIVEDNVPHKNGEGTRKSDSPDMRQSKSYKKVAEYAENKQVNGETEFSKPTELSKIKSLKLKKTHKGMWENKDPISVSNSEDKEIETNNNISKGVSENVDATKSNSEGIIVLSSASTVDTQLPNNQEGLLYRESNERNSIKDISVHKTENKVHKKKSRKREHSQSSTEPKKKLKKIKNKEACTETLELTNNAEDTVSSERNSIEAQINNENHKTDLEHNDNVQSNCKSVDVSKDNENDYKTRPSACSPMPKVSPSEINPCLKSVSLFAEQFSPSKYSDSDNNTQSNVKEVNATVHQEAEEHKSKNNALNSQKTEENNSTLKKDNASKCDDVVVLKSNSESDSVSPPAKSSGSSVNKTREKVLANLFGFSSARGSRLKPRGFRERIKLSRHAQRRRTTSKNTPSRIVELASSDEYTTTESDTDSSRTQKRKNKLLNKYVKPDYYNVLSHGEMGLFMAGRKRIFPLILKEGNLFHNGTAANSDSDEEESYWKSKYLEQSTKLAEEKLRANELAKLLERTKQLLEESKKRSKSPILQSDRAPLQVNKPEQNQEVVLKNITGNETSGNNVRLEPEQKKTVKIKFTRDRDIEFEGSMSQMEPVLERMVQMFNKSDDTKSDKSQDDNKSNKTDVKDSKTDDKNSKTNVKNSKTDVKNSKIDVKDSKTDGKKSKADVNNSKTDDKNSKSDVKNSKTYVKGSKTNVKKSQAEDELRVVRISSDRSSGQSTPLIAVDTEVHEKVNKIESEIFKTIEEIDKQDPNKAEDTNITKRRRGRPKKVLSESASNTSLESMAKVQKIANETAQNDTANIEKTHQPNALPSDAQSESGHISRRKTIAPKKYASDAEIVRVTRKAKSTGKEDSVEIPENDSSVRYKFPKRKSEHTSIYLKKEPRIFSSPDYSRLSESTQGYQDSDISPPSLIVKKRRVNTKSFSHRRKIRRSDHPYLADIDTCESTFSSIRAKQKTTPNSSYNSEVYRSESYQLLMPTTRPFMQLEKIDETKPTERLFNTQNRPNSEPTVKPMEPLIVHVDFKIDNPSCDTSAPITGTGSLGGNSSNISYPLSPELSIVENLSLVKDLISDSIGDHPTLNETHASGPADSNNYNKYFITDVDVSVPLMAQNCELQQNQVNKYEKATITKSLVKTIHSVNMEEPSCSDSLDQKLQNLLIESAKKNQSKGQIGCNLMEVDPITTEVQKKRAIKRSSTPRKRKTSKIKTPNAETLEEHTTSCSYGGKTVCPPTIKIIASEEQIDNNNLNVSDKPVTIQKTRGRKKANILKVKIQRPKRAHSSGRISVCTDSGINDTESEVFLQECYSCNDSVNLIHNHSDTCLQTNECLGDSVEFIENLTKSVLLVHDSISMGKEINFKTASTSGDILAPEIFNKDAQDAVSPSSVAQPLTHSDSLLTDDLSDDDPVQTKPGKWYILSEDESNTNFLDARSQNSNSSTGGANLNQIFPLTCAVPDLSTISEISKETDSRRFAFDSDLETVSNSSNQFN